MDATYWIAREFHPALRWLGRLGAAEEWLAVKTGDRPLTSEFSPRWGVISSAPGFAGHRDQLSKLVAVAGEIATSRGESPAAGLCFLRALAAHLADGPKLVIPTAEQYDAAQHIDNHVPICEYRQPYPSVAVAIPGESLVALAAEFSLDRAKLPAAHLVYLHRTTTGANTVMQWLGESPAGRDDPNYVSHWSLIGDHPEFTDLEAGICTQHRKPGETGPVMEGMFALAQRCFRAGLNLMMLLTHYGHADAGPLEPKRYAKHRSAAKFDHLRLGDYRTVEMAQHVTVREEPGPSGTGKGAGAGATGRQMCPHWRRGHWRRLHPHPETGDPRRCFVRPCLVRADRAAGDLGDSSAEYLGAS